MIIQIKTKTDEKSQASEANQLQHTRFHNPKRIYRYGKGKKKSVQFPEKQLRNLNSNPDAPKSTQNAIQSKQLFFFKKKKRYSC